MITYGIIFCAWGTSDLLPRSISPWLHARSSSLGGHRWLIAAVSCPFENFDAGADDGTQAELRRLHQEGQIDALVTSDTPMTETAARSQALRELVRMGADTIIQVDADEFYEVEEIARLASFVNSRPQIACFKGSLRNYVFNTHTYLTQPFTPMRVHRVRVGDLTAAGFWDDNNIIYRTSDPGRMRRDVELPCVTIPKSVVWVRHETWISDERSRKKVAYQEARGWTCSFAWDDSRGGLIWRDGVLPGETAQDSAA